EMRNTKRYPVEGTNSLWQIYKTVSFFKVMKNFIIISIGRFMPLLSVNNCLYRTFLKMNVGKVTAFALMVMPYIMFPEMIFIGNNVLIGANTTILPGVEIGDNAIISAASLVHKNVEKNTFVGGNPMKLIYSDKDLTQ